ncbi:COX15/CtaA family protein [Bosea sp. BH3]|uniref:COX15/CtaA family protein n=1 Tax=Bosea sp. BH3 TaxID=2871701 RepID=UPI002916460C|nr:COX15/CtaA family protein [Bosea sp. BH3]MCU4181874.1 COX15/CtaA family protein [Bosea sp. BH3]
MFRKSGNHFCDENPLHSRYVTAVDGCEALPIATESPAPVTIALNQPAGAAAKAASHAGIRRWLWIVAGLVFVMVVVGGATRLTGSGLSITEWKPITGALPPLSAAAWAEEFAKYQASPQYQILNNGMSLGEFQFIYWWEWGHRQLGRFIGLVYLGGFLIVALGRLLPARLTLTLFGMGLLLGLQGTIGWIMVASGLQPGMVAVAPVKLTLHLTFAGLFFASVIAFATALTPLRRVEPARGRGTAWLLLLLLFVQVALGGLVAGSKAGFTFNTWPLMDGALVPPAATLFAVSPFWENFVDNVALVQFNHRIGAYLLFAVALWNVLRLRRVAPQSGSAKRSTAIASLVLAQSALGVVTLLLVVPLWAGLAHQALGFAVLAMGVVHVTRTERAARA